MKWVVPFGFALLLGSCKVVREGTYPPSFDYLERSQVRTQMERFAQEVQVIDRAFAVRPVDRTAVLSGLRTLESLARELSASNTTTNHPEIDRNLPAFLTEISAARAGAEADPPNDFLAGNVTGSCRYCHH
ncbi:MAG: hypothetical protein HYV07_14995 [Deltaproteobacteria bacterium]|nr:hypothetical protein [Deltaproteobacteria bacterium]